MVMVAEIDEDEDDDSDEVLDVNDNQFIINPLQEDFEGDGIGDPCDGDDDGDGISDIIETIVDRRKELDFRAIQTDKDGDGCEDENSNEDLDDDKMN